MLSAIAFQRNFVGDDKSKNERRKEYDWDERTKWLIRRMMNFLISNKGFLDEFHKRSYWNPLTVKETLVIFNFN